MIENEEDMEEIIGKMKRFLSVRERCESEVIQYLRKKGFSESDGIKAARKLKSEGIIDDERFARNRMESRIRRGYGPLYIKNELRVLKIKDEMIARALSSDSDDPFLERAVQILEQKLPGLIAHEDAEEKLHRLLLYRGFTDNHFRHAIKMIRIKFPHWAIRRSDKFGQE